VVRQGSAFSAPAVDRHLRDFYLPPRIEIGATCRRAHEITVGRVDTATLGIEEDPGEVVERVDPVHPDATMSRTIDLGKHRVDGGTRIDADQA